MEKCPICDQKFTRENYFSHVYFLHQNFWRSGFNLEHSEFPDSIEKFNERFSMLGFTIKRESI